MHTSSRQCEGRAKLSAQNAILGLRSQRLPRRLRLEPLEARCLLALVADIVDIDPDPRTTPVGEVAIHFRDSETGDEVPVFNVGVEDFRLTRNGAEISLAGVPFGGDGASYTLDLTEVTGAAGAYALTLVAEGSEIEDELGNPLSADAVDSWLTDDQYEENDTLRAAAYLGQPKLAATLADLALADANDWFAVKTTAKGAAQHRIAIEFEHKSGDLDLQLYSASGKRLRSSTSLTDGEQVSLSGLAAGTYYVRVFGKAGATNPQYSLTLTLPQKLVDDAYEQNDSQSKARHLGTPAEPLTIANLVMADARDWYRFTTKSEGTAADFVSIAFLNANGNLDLELYDSRGARVARSAGTNDGELISLEGRGPDTYFIHVFGVGGAKNPDYSLTIDAPDIPPPPPGSTTFDITLQMTGLTTEQAAIVQQAADRWESIIIGNLPSAFYIAAGSTTGIPVDDILIEVVATSIDGVGNTLADALPDRFRTGSNLPYHGFIRLDSADLAMLEASGRLLPTLIHEMGHVLGFGTIWLAKGLLLGAGSTATGATGPRFIGPKAVAAYNEIFGLSSTFVPVENTGPAGTRDSHWRETTFGNELMTGALGTAVEFPLSRITVASMADLGYAVNMAAADPYIPPGIPLVALTAVTTDTSTASVIDELLADWPSLSGELV